MSMTTFSAQVDEDSGLVDRFEEYRNQMGMTKSEAVRSLLRQSLERELDDDDEDAQRDQRDRDDAVRSSNDWIEGNEGILLGVAFLIGSDGILASLQSVAGATIGALLYATLGMLIIASLFPMFARHIRRLIDQDDDDSDHTGAAGAS
jgi:Arc/MetJ-type ribon-helix-helix transcriptional regulator